MTCQPLDVWAGQESSSGRAARIGVVGNVFYEPDTDKFGRPIIHEWTLVMANPEKDGMYILAKGSYPNIITKTTKWKRFTFNYEMQDLFTNRNDAVAVLIEHCERNLKKAQALME